MKQFKKWKEKRAIKTMGWLNNSSAYIAGEEAGWKAALKWLLTQATSGIEENGSISYCNYVSLDVIKKELEDE